MSCGVIIAAAGQGKRMGRDINKQFIELDNKPILVHTIEKFNKESWIDKIIVVANPVEIDEVRCLLNKFNVKVDAIVPGGKERQDSIKNGLAHVDCEYVMIHDGARPFVSSKILNNLYQEVLIKKAIVLGVKVKDTIKVVDKSNKIITTPKRESLWMIQTPQAFSLSLINKAYKNAIEENYLGTDDSSLVEMIGYEVHIIEGDYNNIKITTPEDLFLAKNILDNWSEID